MKKLALNDKTERQETSWTIEKERSSLKIPEQRQYSRVEKNMLKNRVSYCVCEVKAEASFLTTLYLLDEDYILDGVLTFELETMGVGGA